MALLSQKVMTPQSISPFHSYTSWVGQGT